MYNICKIIRIKSLQEILYKLKNKYLNWKNNYNLIYNQIIVSLVKLRTIVTNLILKRI